MIAAIRSRHITMSKIPSRCFLNASSLLFALTFALIAARADDQPRGMPISGKYVRSPG
jgi:hypothetical protein